MERYSESAKEQAREPESTVGGTTETDTSTQAATDTQKEENPVSVSLAVCAAVEPEV